MIVFKENIDSQITDIGIYYCSITVSFMDANEKTRKIIDKIVYSKYTHGRCIGPFIEKNVLESLGVKKTNLKQTVHMKLEVLSFLGNVHSDTYKKWQEAQIKK